MPQVRMNCPNCRQPIAANVEQLFDLNRDASAKQRLLSGTSNLIHCPHCGYQGNIATPLVYHDPEKELLLTFIPPELGGSRQEQERVIGKLINQVVEHLSPEKRKGYLFSPQAALTMQGFIERILEADGITREMLQDQQNRLNLIRRLANVSEDDVLETIAQQEDSHIDGEFFALLRRLTEASLVSGDRASAEKLQELSRKLIPITTYGREWKKQSQEVETAIKDLQSLGKEISRESLLSLVIQAPNDIRLSTYVSIMHPAMDYIFFQQLSERIDAASGDERAHLEKLREKLLEMTREIDELLAARQQEIRKSIEEILQSDHLEEALMKIMPQMDDLFIEELNRQMEEARRAGDLKRSSRLEEVLSTLRNLTTPAEIALLEEYLEVEDEAERQRFLEEHTQEINDQFLELLASFALQIQSGEDAAFADHVMRANRQALRFVMEKNLKKS